MIPIIVLQKFKVIDLIVESKNDPNGSKIEMTSLDPNPVPSYPFTNNTGTDINPSNTNVNVNTSHSIEKYPEV
jgi:hypothetical protein